MKKIFPKKIVLSRDECVRSGKIVIGWWEKDYEEGTSHFRPSPNEGRLYYKATLINGDFVYSYTFQDLRKEILSACKDGIEPEDN